MSLKSTPTHYGNIAVALHWISALAIILMLISGLVLAGATDPAQAAMLARFHVFLGLSVAVLTVLRIVWWLAFDKHPAPLVGTGRAQEWAARLVHLGLYGAIIMMVASGLGLVLLTGALPQIVSGLALPDFSAAPPSAVHGLVGRLLILLAIGHIGAALYHQFLRRDNLLARMRFRR